MFFYYLVILGYYNMPDFLIRFLNAPSLLRLKNIGYFCGMDFASKDIYKFREYISRFDHSLSVCLNAYSLTHDKETALKALFHDVSTPCFSHVIDYMNKDYKKQESTEAYTEIIIRNDDYLKRCLDEEGIDINSLINYKSNTIVDNDRPKLCADRLDGVITTDIGWTQVLSKEDIKNIIEDRCIYTNEYGEDEIGFKTIEVAKKVVEVSNLIDIYCHSKEDNYMMDLLARITKLIIWKKYIKYEDLYYLDEMELFSILNSINDNEVEHLLYKFKNIKKDEISDIYLPSVKKRILRPLVNGVRL